MEIIHGTVVSNSNVIATGSLARHLVNTASLIAVKPQAALEAIAVLI